MGYDWALNFVQNSSLIPLYIWNPFQPAFTKLPAFLLLLFLFLIFFIFKRKKVNLGGNPKIGYNNKYGMILSGWSVDNGANSW